MRYLLHDVFTQAVETAPNKIAIIEENGCRATYAALNGLSNQYANRFLSFKSCIRTQPFIGILSTVCIESIAAVLGCLKIGCAYVPLDEQSPTERLIKVIEHIRLDMVVIDPRLYDLHKTLFDCVDIKVLILLRQGHGLRHPKIIERRAIEQAPTSNPPLLNQVSDDLAYILHSSGSTGVPKGIMLTHRNARTFVDWMHKEFQVHSEDIIVSRAPFKFDLSVFDVFNTFKAGATLVCYDWMNKRVEHKKHIAYVELMVKEKVTFLYTTPTTLITLMNHGKLGEHSNNIKLRTIMYAGEPFQPALLRKLMQQLPKTRIANIYGPTETNIITYYWVNFFPDEDEAIPLGREVDDTEIIVVSQTGDILCGPNEVGELWCRGGTVTLGYLGMPEATRSHLVESPFHAYPTRFWRTGDYGYRDAEGILHYSGRRDHMIKVKGYRIELGEIERALSQHRALDESVVVAISDEDNGHCLYAYYSLLDGQSISADALRVFLSKKLPKHMIPCDFKQKKVLPKTSSGKIDRVYLAKDASKRAVHSA